MSDSRTKPTPRPVSNRASLSQIATRQGSHSRFLESLMRGLADANRPGLAELRTRAGGDFTLGLLSAWAAVADTLEFYAERSANEAYLRTATERQSLRAHARLIGYELAAAKAAAVHLAFTAEQENAPDETLVYDAGLQIRSIPRDDEKPQLFETIEPLTAHADWNAMRPRLTHQQVLTANTDTITIAPGEPRLVAGNPVLFMRGQVPVCFEDAEDTTKTGLLRRVSKLAVLADGNRVLTLSAKPTGTMSYLFSIYPTVLTWNMTTAVSTTTLQSAIPASSWPISGLSTAQAIANLTSTMLSTAIVASQPAAVGPIEPSLMQVVSGCFGNTAITEVEEADPPFPGAITATNSDTHDDAPPGDHVFVYLEREYSDIVAGPPVLLRDALKEGWSEVHAVEHLSVEAYGYSAKVTRLEIDATLTGPDDDANVAASGFLTRRTTVFASPRKLELALLPITADVGESDGDLGADQVELSGPELALFPGKTVAITGERSDLVGVTNSEIRTIADNTLNGGYSVLTFTQALAYAYKRDTVVINANVAEATHGETVIETIGDGDATKAFAGYEIKAYPLTHVSAKTLSGMAPSLEVRVDGVLWSLVEDFRDAGPENQVYILRIAEDQTARIVFGDGTTGQRPSTGLGNIEVICRKGAGSDGMLEAGQLSLLATKPQGLKAVTNPLPPAAAADAEELEDARQNAPLKVLTLGRVVSLRDYEDMARGFAAIAKARADWTFDGFGRPIYLTVAGQGGAILPEDGTDMTNLLETLRASGESDLNVSIRNYLPASFAVEAGLFIDPAYDTDTVITACEDILAVAFAFDARGLGQSVSHAQVIAVLQTVGGVTGVDLDLLYRIGQPPTRETRLISAAARPDLGGAIPAPAELLTIEMSASKLVVAS